MERKSNQMSNYMYSNSQAKKANAQVHNSLYEQGRVKLSFIKAPIGKVVGSGNWLRELKHEVKRSKQEKKLLKESKSPRQQQLNSGYAKIMWLMTLPWVTELP